MHRARRRLALAIAPVTRPTSPPTRITDARVVSVQNTTATVEINVDTANPVPGVPIAPGLAIAAGQRVELTWTGRSPVITDRLT